MTEKEIILRDALLLACEFIRKYPCGEIAAYMNNDMLSILAGGATRDPRGEEFFAEFIWRAKNNGKIF